MPLAYHDAGVEFAVHQPVVDGTAVLRYVSRKKDSSGNAHDVTVISNMCLPNTRYFTGRVDMTKCAG